MTKKISPLDDMRKDAVKNLNNQLISQLTKLNDSVDNIDDANQLNLTLNVLVNKILKDNMDKTIADHLDYVNQLRATKADNKAIS